MIRPVSINRLTASYGGRFRDAAYVELAQEHLHVIVHGHRNRARAEEVTHHIIAAGGSASVDQFSNGTISMKFKTIGGESDRCSGILFNVKPNGDWLAVRYNDTENNVAIWEFHNGIRRPLRFSDRARKFMLDRAAWHELKLTVDGADLKTWLDGELALEYTLGTAPAPGRGNTPPNPDLNPATNPVLRPPVAGKIGLWAKTDTTSYFKDYVVSPR